MLAHVLRIAVALVAALAAVLVFLTLSGWMRWVVPLVIFVVGSTTAEWLFRRLATADMIRSDLEDRVRNPPS
jgi:uncharacterized protein (DUF697 family)